MVSFFLRLFLLPLGKTCFQEGTQEVDPRAIYFLLKMLSPCIPAEKAGHSGGAGGVGKDGCLGMKVLAYSSSALGCVLTPAKECEFTEQGGEQ